MTAEVFDKSNKKVGSIDLPDRIFGVRWNSDLVHQAMLAQQNNARYLRRTPKEGVKCAGEV